MNYEWWLTEEDASDGECSYDADEVGYQAARNCVSSVFNTDAAEING